MSNEIKDLREKEAKVKKELEILSAKEQNNVCSFQLIQLQNEIKKLHSKLKIIMSGHTDDDSNNLA